MNQNYENIDIYTTESYRDRKKINRFSIYGAGIGIVPGLVIGFIAVGFEGSLMFGVAGVLAGLLIGNLVGWIKVQFSS